MFNNKNEQNSLDSIKNDLSLNFSIISQSNSELGIKVYSSLVSSIIYFINETKIKDYIKENEENIDKYSNQMKKGGLYYIKEALKFIEDKNYELFKNNIYEIQKIFNERNNNNNKSISEMSYTSLIFNDSISNSSINNGFIMIYENKEIFRFIFDKLIYNCMVYLFYQNNNIKYNKNEIKINLKNAFKSEEEAIKNYEEYIIEKTKDKNIINFFDSFLFGILENDSYGQYKMKAKYGFHWDVKEIFDIKNNDKKNDSNNIIINEISLDDFLNYQYSKGKIYFPSEIMIINFDNNKYNYKIKYEIKVTLNLYTGESVNYNLGGIIFMENDDFICLVSESLDGKIWKTYDNNSGDVKIQDHLSYDPYDLPQPIMLFYKKIND